MLAEALAQLGTGDCEAIAGGVIGQPVNALSSLAYAAIGIWVLTRVRHTHPDRPWGPMIFGIALLSVSFGSVVFHGPMPGWALLAHDLSNAAAVLFIVVYDLFVLRPGWAPGMAVAGYFVSVGALGILFAAVPTSSVPVTAAFVVAAVALEYLVYRADRRAGFAHRRTLVLYGAIGIVLAVAATAYLLGQTGGELCDPNSPFQLHGLWHVLTAVAFGLFASVAFDPDSHRPSKAHESHA